MTIARKRPPKPPAPADPVTAYAQAVVDGGVVAGRLVRLAAERHLRDLQEGPARGLEFRPEIAGRVSRYYSALRLPDGAAAGQPFILQPWQEFVTGSVMGWVRADGTRRFRYGYVEVARANGKSPLLAGLGLYGLMADGEPGAQVYAAATTRDQAKILFSDADRMRERSPGLAARITKTVNNLAYPQGGSFFRPLSADASTMDGLRVHMALVDELHEHPNGNVLTKLRTGMKSSQPLLMMITTAGYDRNSVCWQEHDHGVKVLEGIIENDAYFAYIATIDEDAGDAWDDETCWPKANPSLGVTVRLDTLREECELARQIPAQQNAFKRLRLSMWTEQATRWVDMDLYDENNVHPIEPEDLAGRLCYGGLDLSTTTDITARALLFRCPHDAGAVDVVMAFWVPADNMLRRAERDRVPYGVWADQGYISPTEGNVVDYEVIREDMNQQAARFQVHEVGYDPWNATQLATQLQADGATMVPVRQGFATLSAPSKELEALILGKRFHHGGNPVLRWMFSNVAVRTDAGGNIKPDKEKSTERIDGAVAVVTALARMIVHDGGDGRSVYEERGILFL